ncbi:MAG: hypothetical protein GPJ54_21415 [Candidatus Heimdallarchaeota archaeon]|nr:hypothetical protein [Candidatus Heimdallarchaeota archaeon]
MVLLRKSYKVGMRFSGDQPREIEKRSNTLVRRYQEIVEEKIIQNNMVEQAYDLIDKNPGLSGTFGARHLAKKVSDGSNIGQVACTYALSAVNGAIDREHKLGEFLKLFGKHPKEAVSWVIFQRTPFLETSLARILKVNFEYSRNLILSAGRNLKSGYADIILPKLENIDFIEAVDEIEGEVKDKFAEMKSEGKNLKRIQSFLNKIEFLKKHKEFMSMCLYHWLTYERNNPTNSRWRSLKKLSREFTFMLGYKRQRRLFSAIRGVVVHALSSILDETVKNIFETVKLRDLVAKPYKKQRRKLAPVNLIMGSKYVITRPGNAKLLTQLALQDQRFTLGIKNPDIRGQIIHGDVIIHKRMLKMMMKGASITSLSIRSGDAPGCKIIITIHLEGTEDMFLSTNFMKSYPDLKLKQSDIIGLDVNRVGPYVLVFSQKNEIPKMLSTICKRYITLGEVISKLSAAFSKNLKNENEDRIKLRGELNRVYLRRKRLLKEIKTQCKLLSTAVLIQSKAKQFNVEDLQMSARGKRGSLAKAILSMPDEINIFEKAVILASSYRQTNIELNLINPFKTSSTHYNCGGKLRRSLGNWDICACTFCKVEVNTHFNAALHIRDGGVLA